MEHFGSHSGHRVVEEQVFGESSSRYLGFRTNSYCYVFEADGIRLDGIHWKAYWPDTFKARRHLVEDFARTSKFREFYRANMSYYQEQIAKYRREVPIEQMWQWLEERFPARFDCYRVVLSPLIRGTHNTQDFGDGTFREAVMFVAMGPILEGNRRQKAYAGSSHRVHGDRPQLCESGDGRICGTGDGLTRLAAGLTFSSHHHRTQAE